MDTQRRWGALWLWRLIGWGLVLTVVMLSIVPSIPVGSGPGFDKIGHFVAYSTLMAWHLQYVRSNARIALGVGFAGLGLGLEIVQSMIAYRTFDLFDTAANAIGVGIGWAITAVLGFDLLYRIDRRWFQSRGNGG